MADILPSVRINLTTPDLQNQCPVAELERLMINCESYITVDFSSMSPASTTSCRKHSFKNIWKER